MHTQGLNVVEGFKKGQLVLGPALHGNLPAEFGHDHLIDSKRALLRSILVGINGLRF